MAKANGAQISVPNGLTPQKPPAMSSFSPISALVTSINISLSHPILSLSHSLLSLSLSQSNLPPNLHPYLPALSLYLSLHRHRHRHPHPIMLFHLSNHIKKKNTSLYSLAAILITLSKTLFKIKNLPNDPSLFMHRFSTRLLGHNDSVVSITALQILAEVKAAVEDYDKNPVGFCTAALHLAASAHGHVFSQADVSNAVRVEFKRLGSEELTVEEFVSRAGKRKTKGLRSVCGHEGSGLCKGCYEVFVDIAGAEQSKKKRRRRNENDDLDVYVNSKKETEYRRVIWEEMNKEYLEEQLAKKIAGLSSVKVMKARKGRVKGGGAGKEKKVEEKRVMSSKVNYDALAKLLGDGEGGKKSDMDAGSSGEERKDGGEEEEGGEEFDEENHNEEEDYEGGSDGYEEGCGGGEYNENWGNGNEGYGDDEDDDDDDFFEF